MFNKFKNIFLIVFFFIFIFFITKYYFSEENIVAINKSRLSYEISLNNNNKLPLLKSDTGDTITYIDDVENYKKKRKKRFWEKLIYNNNE